MYINNWSYFWVLTSYEKINYREVYYKQPTVVLELKYVTYMQDNQRKNEKYSFIENKLEYTFCGKLQQHSPNNHMTC